MLITFHSKATADILMRSEDAAPILRAAGKPMGDQMPERGVFALEQLPVAIAGLEGAIHADAGNEPHDEDDPDQPAPHPIERKVALRQRAFPLLDMMRKSLAAGESITWETSRGW